jgi:hypothetical protein
MSSNVDALRAELEGVDLTHDRADFVGAVALAGNLLAGEAGERRLVILSDMQASNWVEALDGLSAGGVLAVDTRVTVLPTGHGPVGNMAVHGATVSPERPRIGQAARLGVMLTNHSDQERATTVELLVNGRSVGARSLSVEARGTVGVTFETDLDVGGDHRVEFRLPGDGLAGDDRSYLTVRAVERVGVLVVTDDDIDLPGTAGYFMVRALAPYGDGRDRFDVRRVHSGQDSWGGLEGTAAVFVGDVGVLPVDRVEGLRRYMEGGGGVVYFCGGGPVVENLLALGGGGGEGVLPWLPEARREMRRGEGIAGGDWGSPLLNRFEEAGREALSGLSIRRYWYGGEVDEGAELLLWYSDGTPAMVWRGVGMGRLVLANFGVGAGDSDLGKQGLFVAMMQGLAEDVRGASAEGGRVVGRSVEYTTAERIDLNGPVPVVLFPDGKTGRDIALSMDENRSAVTISNPDLPGFYVTLQGEKELAVTAVNLDPRESDLRRVPADQVYEALSGAGAGVAGRAGEAGPVLGLRGKVVWGWLVVIAMTCLGLEMGLLGYYRR